MRHLFSRRPKVTVIFEGFRRLLQCNHRAFEIITDLGEKLGGDFLFDRRYLETSVIALARAVRESIDSLHVLDQDQHRTLLETADRLDQQIKAILAGHEDGDEPAIADRKQTLLKTTGQAFPELLNTYETLCSGQGTVAQQGIGAGPVWEVNTPEDLARFPRGAVLVSRRDSAQFARVMPLAAAIVTELGTPVSHMAILCRDFGVPCLVNVPGIMTRVENGMEITVDAEDRRIYKGRVHELLAWRDATGVDLAVMPEFRLLRRVFHAVSRLNLVDPLLDQFTAQACQSYHDILRYVHETAVVKLVDLGRDERGLLRDHLARHLDLPIPAGIMVIDIGGGLTPDAPLDNVPFRAITSVPFRAILQGMLFPEVWHRVTMSVGFRDLFMGMLNVPNDALSGQYSGHNIAIASKDWVNLCFRFGYHFNIIDALCNDVDRDNHIYFRFLGGATDLTKRSRRTRLIGKILEALEFSVRIKDDMVIGRASNMMQSEMERTLDLLGRLVAFTRQLDVRMDHDGLIDRYFEAFMLGDYEIIARQ